MLETHHSPIVESLGEALETMAFISPVPIDPPEVAPGEPLLCRIDFAGPLRGTIEVMVGRQFAVLLCANMLGGSPEHPQARASAEDAVKELLNVTCGGFLARLHQPGTRTFTVSLPSLSTADSAPAWRSFVESPAAATFDVDGDVLAIRVSEAK